MPVQLVLRSPKGGRILAESTYDAGYRIDATSGWLVVVDRNGSVIAAHAACPGLEGAVVEYTSTTAAHPHNDEEGDGGPERDAVTGYPALDRRLGLQDTTPPPDEDDGFPPSLANEARDDDDRFAAELLTDLQRLGDTYGPLGVALAAASLTDRRALIACLIDNRTRPEPTPPSRYAVPADPLDAQIVCLGNWIADNVPGEPSQPQGAIDTAIRLLAEREETLQTYRDEVEEQTARAEQAENDRDAARKRVGRLTAERDELRATVALYRHRYGSVMTWNVDDGPTPAADDRVPHEPVDLRPVEEDPRRPHLDHYPSDAILLTYREVRRLLGLHLEACSGDPQLARAMYDGEAPLRLAEVLA